MARKWNIEGQAERREQWVRAAVLTGAIQLDALRHELVDVWGPHLGVLLRMPAGVGPSIVVCDQEQNVRAQRCWLGGSPGGGY